MTIPEEIEQLKAQISQTTNEEEEAAVICALLKKSRATGSVDLKIYIDRLLQLAENLNNSSYKAWARHSLAVFQRNIGEYSNSLNTIAKARAIFEQMGDKNGVAASIKNVGSVYYLLGDYPQALENYFECLSMYRDLGDQDGVSSSYNNIGLTHHLQSNFSEALRNHLAALEIEREENNEIGMANSYNNIGNINMEQGNYPVALKNQFEALKIREAIGDKRGIANSYNNIGNIYEKQGKHAEALTKQLASLELRKEIGDIWGVGMSYCNIGNHYQNQDNYGEALKNHLRSLRIRKKIGDKWGIANAYVNSGIDYQHQGKYTKALSFFKAGLKMRQEIGDKKGIALSYTNMGSVYQMQGNYNKAISAQIEALRAGEEIGFKDVMKESSHQLFNIYKSLRDYENALKYFEKYHEIEKEMLGVESQKQLTNLSFQHNLEQIEREAEINRLRNIQLEAQTEKAEKETAIALRKALNAQFDQHFLNSMLTSINLFILENKGDAIDYIARFAKYVRGILKHSDEDIISLEQELEEIENYIVLEKIRHSNRFSYQIRIGNGVNLKNIFVPPLIFQSLVENSIKHGFNSIDYEGQIILDIDMDAKQLVCRVSDNGVGYHPSVSSERKSFGLSITQQRIELYNRQNTKKMRLNIEQNKKGVSAVLTLNSN